MLTQIGSHLLCHYPKNSASNAVFNIGYFEKVRKNQIFSCTRILNNLRIEEKYFHGIQKSFLLIINKADMFVYKESFLTFILEFLLTHKLITFIVMLLNPLLYSFLCLPNSFSKFPLLHAFLP